MGIEFHFLLRGGDNARIVTMRPETPLDGFALGRLAERLTGHGLDIQVRGDELALAIGRCPEQRKVQAARAEREALERGA